MKIEKDRTTSIVLALLIPFVTCWVQWQYWFYIKPFVWFLFFPAVFFSSRIGGKSVGFVSTVTSAFLVVYYFIPPQLSFSDKSTGNLISVAMFLIMGVLFSLTHDKLEKAKRKAADALEDSRIANGLLQESNEKVTQLYEKTLRLDELKTRFFANVSHELRTPLTLIIGPVGRLLASSGLCDEEMRELKVIDRNARILYRQVTDLLDVSKLEAGRMSLHYSTVDLADLVRFVVSLFEIIAQEKSITFRVETPDTLLSQVDSEKCRRILLNLLSNAFKFTQDGGKITITLRKSAETAIFTVQDNGPGIPEDKRKMVFERFSQVDGGAERKFGGTGLGLTIVKEFVELQRGSIELAEAPGGGALFTVVIPLSAPDNATINVMESEMDELFLHMVPDEVLQQKQSRNSVDSSEAPLILVVEDNSDMNGYITSLLGGKYRVAGACNGEEGLAAALLLHPDLIICDVMMPLMSGDRMVQALRSRPEMDTLPIIILSARADDDLMVSLLKNGVQDYMTKPFSDAELLARVSGLLAGQERTAGKLLRSDERFRRLFTSAPVPLCYVTKAGELSEINERFTQMFGYTHEDVPTLVEWWQRACPDANYRALALETLNKAVDMAATTGGDIETIENNVTCKQGEVRTVQISGITLGDEFLATFFDVTERRRTEMVLRQQTEDLQQRNAELERFDRASVGRELEMIRLKRWINELSRQAGQESPFDLSFADEEKQPSAGATP